MERFRLASARIGLQSLTFSRAVKNDTRNLVRRSSKSTSVFQCTADLEKNDLASLTSNESQVLERTLQMMNHINSFIHNGNKAACTNFTPHALVRLSRRRHDELLLGDERLELI